MNHDRASSSDSSDLEFIHVYSSKQSVGSPQAIAAGDASGGSSSSSPVKISSPIPKTSTLESGLLDACDASPMHVSEPSTLATIQAELLRVEHSSVSSSSSSSEDWDYIPVQPGTAELSVESALLWCLSPAIRGIRSIGVSPAQERARKLLHQCSGDATAAVVLAAGDESGGTKRTRIIFEFLLRQVPFVGCPAYVLTSTWTHIRTVATIAAIYGHDLELARTQHEILWCLLPAQSAESSAPLAGDNGPISATAKTVSNVLISTALKRTIGVAMVSDLFQLGTDLWTISSCPANAADGFAHLSLGPSARARNYFCPETKIEKWKLGLAFLGVVIPWLIRLPPFGLSLLVLSTVVATMYRHDLLRSIIVRSESPKIASYAIFSLHAFLPVQGIATGISHAFQAVFPTAPLLPSIAERMSLLLLAAMALSSGLKGAGIWPTHMHDLHVHVRRMAVVVGIVLHVLPWVESISRMDQVYTRRIAYLLSDVSLCTPAKSIHYLSVLTSATAMPLLQSQLRQRDIILRLLGAERVMILSLTLFFRGLTAAVTTDSLVPLFRQISPHPIFCCLVMTLRRFPLQFAFVLALLPMVPTLTASPVLSLLSGLLVGTSAILTLWSEWKRNESAYMSNMRLLYILPGAVTGKTKEVIDTMLKAGGRTAIKSVLVGLVKRTFNNRFFSTTT